MPYDNLLVQPMREEMTHMGVTELLSADAVDNWMGGLAETSLLFINSVCGCAAGMARPGLALALDSGKRPARIATVFAGQDLDATARARSYLSEIPPSSPSMALFKGKEMVWFMPRHAIEGRDARSVAVDLATAFGTHCD